MSLTLISDEWDEIAKVVARKGHDPSVMRLLRHTYFAGAAVVFRLLVEEAMEGDPAKTHERLEDIALELSSDLRSKGEFE